MSQLSNILRDVEGNGLMFWCPGCQTSHLVYHGVGSGPRWNWNENVDKPTFTPSILTRTGHYISSHKIGDDCWCTYNIKYPDRPSKFKCGICHSFVTDGRIQFLSDCTHELAGQTVDLPDWPY
jgi:hypothetical protein